MSCVGLCWAWHTFSRKVPEGPGRFPEVVPEAAGIYHAAEHRKALVMHGQGIGKYSKTKEIKPLMPFAFFMICGITYDLLHLLCLAVHCICCMARRVLAGLSACIVVFTLASVEFVVMESNAVNVLNMCYSVLLCFLQFCFDFVVILLCFVQGREIPEGPGRSRKVSEVRPEVGSTITPLSGLLKPSHIYIYIYIYIYMYIYSNTWQGYNSCDI